MYVKFLFKEIKVNKIDVLVKYFGPPKMTDRNGNSYFHCPFCNHHNNKLPINKYINTTYYY